MRVFNAWMKDIAEGPENLKMQFESATDKCEFAAKAE